MEYWGSCHSVAKSFLLETVRYYPSNRFLSYWKPFATIRETFCLVQNLKNMESHQPKHYTPLQKVLRPILCYLTYL